MSLAEATTEPTENTPELTEKLVAEELYLFLRNRLYSFMLRLSPYVDRIEENEELEMPHIWLVTEVPLKDPSEATLAGLESELHQFADQLCLRTQQGVVLSIVLNE